MTELEPSYWPDPIDDIEPQVVTTDAYREASRKFFSLIDPIMEMLRADKYKASRWWQIQFALGTSHCIGRDMGHAGALCGVDKAAMSKGAVEVCNILKIPPSPYMKNEAARKSYKQLRKKQLKKP